MHLMLSFLFYKYLSIEWLCLIIHIYFTFWKSPKLFPKVIVPFYILISSTSKFQLLRILSSIWFVWLDFFILAFQVRCVVVSRVWIYIFLMANVLSIFLYTYLPSIFFCMWWSVYSCLLPVLNGFCVSFELYILYRYKSFVSFMFWRKCFLQFLAFFLNFLINVS